nr:MAG TPA: hypothetical protein [Caudoviricetes sp.]
MKRKILSDRRHHAPLSFDIAVHPYKSTEI